MAETQLKYIHYPHFQSKPKKKIIKKPVIQIKSIDENQLKIKSTQDSKRIQSPDLGKFLKTESKVADEMVFEGYSSQVLTSNWFLSQSSEPKDFNAYNPPGGDNFRSTYKRWGTYDEKMTTETRETQAIFMREQKKKVPKIHRSLLNIMSLQNFKPEQYLQSVVDEPDKKHKKQVDMYSTSMQRDFINYYPKELKMIDRTQLYKPETKYRNLLTELTHPRRPGYNKFYDENLEYLNAKRTGIAPPPYALHFTPLADLMKTANVKNAENNLEIKEELCAKCT